MAHTAALTVLIRQRAVGGDLDRARKDAMASAPSAGFSGEPESVEELESDDGEKLWAFFWERTEA